MVQSVTSADLTDRWLQLGPTVVHLTRTPAGADPTRTGCQPCREGPRESRTCVCVPPGRGPGHRARAPAEPQAPTSAAAARWEGPRGRAQDTDMGGDFCPQMKFPWSLYTSFQEGAPPIKNQ